MELRIMITVWILLLALGIWLCILRHRANVAREKADKAKDDASSALSGMHFSMTSVQRGLDEAKSSLCPDDLEALDTAYAKAQASLSAAETAFRNVLSAYRMQTQDPIDERLSQDACDTMLARLTEEVEPKIDEAETDVAEYTSAARGHSVGVREAGPLMAGTVLQLTEIARLSANAKIVRLRTEGDGTVSLAELEDAARRAKAALEERRFRTAYAILAPMQGKLTRTTSTLTDTLATHARIAQERDRIDRDARAVRQRVSAASNALGKAVAAHPKAAARIATLQKAANEKALEAMLHASLARQSLQEEAAVDLRRVEERNRTAAAVLAVAATGAVALEGYADRLVASHKRQVAKAGAYRPDLEEFVPDPEDILDVLESIGTFETPAINAAFADAPSGGSHGGSGGHGNGGHADDGHDGGHGDVGGDPGGDAGDGGCGGGCGGD